MSEDKDDNKVSRRVPNKRALPSQSQTTRRGNVAGIFSDKIDYKSVFKQCNN